jgi:hypothetical protein
VPNAPLRSVNSIAPAQVSTASIAAMNRMVTVVHKMVVRLRFFEGLKRAWQSSAISFLCTFSVLGVSGCSWHDDSLAEKPKAAAISVVGAQNDIYPAFSQDIRHYALVSSPTDTIELTLTAQQPGTTISSGTAASRGILSMAIRPEDAGRDFSFELVNGGIANHYVLHYLPEDFPIIDVTEKNAGVVDGFIITSFIFNRVDEVYNYGVIMDNNGVPRIYGKDIVDIKRHDNGMFSSMQPRGLNAYGLMTSEHIVMDADFNTVDRVTTVGLNHTDGHDFIITPEGNYILIAYHTTLRDMTAYGYSDNEPVGDSVIQEITPDRDVVFQWSSWGNIDLSDCIATGYRKFPADYAHLNSIFLTEDGHIVASFRGCSQILKIARPTGDVIWRLGGSHSDFTIVGDPYEAFCGQHGVSEHPDGRLLVFDNGSYCIGDREDRFGTFSRFVEYQLDYTNGIAGFVRDYAIRNEYTAFAGSGGGVHRIQNGSVIIGWGNGPDTSLTEIDGNNKVMLSITAVADGLRLRTPRAAKFPGYRPPGS